MNKRRLTDAEVLAQIPAARARARATEPVARDVTFERAARQIRLLLTNGVSITVPLRLIKSLDRATDAALEKVRVGAAGISIRWDSLDEDLSIVGLAALALGTRTLMRASGAAGGSARSRAKAIAARVNGRKGGRPRGRTLLSPRVGEHLSTARPKASRKAQPDAARQR
jgi:hypothetical protein